MPVILPVKGATPQWGDDCFIAPNATIVGDVVMGSRCSVWFNAVVRGDVNSIRIGEGCNIQDGAIIHCTYEKTKAILGSWVSVGHNAIIHGCTVEDQALIGMGSIVMDNAVIGKGAIVAAGAVVLEGTEVEENAIYAGIPAKKIKIASDEQREKLLATAQRYVTYGQWFK